jgi:hypothetical protein
LIGPSEVEGADVDIILKSNNIKEVRGFARLVLPAAED